MRKYWFWMSLIVILGLSGCSQLLPSESLQGDRESQNVESATSTADIPKPTATDEPSTPEPAPTATPQSDATDPDDNPPRFAEQEFTTDFSKHSVPYSEILSGGPPKDGIPAIDNPTFVSVEEADEWLETKEPVVYLQVNGDARAYPLRILTWHEIVNDVVGGEPVVVTFCPLCNTAIAFEATLDGQVLDFGTTGRLRFSNLIMYDRQTETWWQQATGEAIAGEHTGRHLDFLPASLISWQDFKNAFPDGKVLSRDTGFTRDYGRNPYAGYDNINNDPFAYRGPDNTGRLPAMARVYTIESGDEAVAYPYSALQDVRVVNDEFGGQPIAIFWEEGTASALDNGFLPAGRDVGSANSFSRELGEETYTFTFDGENIIDEETQSVWNVLGEAIEGPLAGAELEPVVGVNHFWFSWAAFKPETQIYQPESGTGSS
jgi:hypothetical protein